MPALLLLSAGKHLNLKFASDATADSADRRGRAAWRARDSPRAGGESQPDSESVPGAPGPRRHPDRAAPPSQPGLGFQVSRSGQLDHVRPRLSWPSGLGLRARPHGRARLRARPGGGMRPYCQAASDTVAVLVRRALASRRTVSLQSPPVLLELASRPVLLSGRTP